MPTVHMSETQFASNLYAVLERVGAGDEIVIERNSQAIALLTPPPVPRLISEVLAKLEARGSNAVMDGDFARDIEEGINANRQPWTPPSWD